MTLCIAAICHTAPEIILVSDAMLSTNESSKDASALKMWPLGDAWSFMYEGSPSVARLLWDRMIKTDITTAEIAMETARRAFHLELKQKIEDELLSPLGLTREEFLRDGRDWLGDPEFARMLSELRGMSLATSGILAGFDGGSPRVISVTHPGTCTVHDEPGFCTVGSGWLRAEALLDTTYNRTLSVPELIYRVCEAKFSGEAALGVGEVTTVCSLTPDGRTVFLTDAAVEQIRMVCLEESKRPAPSRAVQLIATNLGEQREASKPRD